MNSVFAVESYACIANEAAPLACAHWRESEAALYGRQQVTAPWRRQGLCICHRALHYIMYIGA